MSGAILIKDGLVGEAPELRDQKGINQPTVNNNTLNNQNTDLNWGGAVKKKATI